MVTSFRSVQGPIRPPFKRTKSLPARVNGVLALFVFIVTYVILSEPPEVPGLKVVDDQQDLFSSAALTQRLLQGDVVLKNQEPHIDFAEQRRAIFLLSFGKAAAENTLLERCILSIRRRGDFHGPVIVLTDAPHERYNGVLDENVVVLQSKDDDMLDYFENGTLKYMRFKTLLLNYIDEIPELNSVEWLYYLDIDIIMGAPLNELLQVANEKYHIEDSMTENEEENPVSRLYFFNNLKSANLPFSASSDFIIMNRRSSRCLDVWRKEIDSRPQESTDEVALNAIARVNEFGGETNCQLVSMEIDNYIFYPQNSYQLMQMARDSRYTSLIHISNSRKAEKMKDYHMKAFVSNVLMLSEEEQEKNMFGNSIITPSDNQWTTTEKMEVSFETDPLAPPKGYPWHRWPSAKPASDNNNPDPYPLNVPKFIAILSEFGKGKTFKAKFRAALKQMKDDNFVRLTGVSLPYIVRDGKVLRPDGDKKEWWTNFSPDEHGKHMDWVTLLESAVSMAHQLVDREPRMKVITEGDFPILFDESDVPWCGDDMVPVFRTNAINDEAECQHSWPSLSIMYYLRNRKNVLRDSRKSWDPYFTEMKATYPWEDKEKLAVWRGRSTGWRELYDDGVIPREKLISIGELNGDIMDVKAISHRPSVYSYSINRPVSGNEMKEEDFMKYRAVIDVEGFGWSARMSTLLCWNSVVIKVEPRWINYWERELIPFVHYIPVQHNLEDLTTRVEWAISDENQEEVQAIIQNANAWCREKMTFEQYTVDFLWTILDYAELLANAPGFHEEWASDYYAHELPAQNMAEFKG